MNPVQQSSKSNRAAADAVERPDHPWSLKIGEVLEALHVDGNQGLEEAEAESRLKEWGANRLREAKTRSTWKILVDQFASLIIGLLALAALAAVIFGRRVEGAAIAIALFLNAAIGFFTELKATRSMEALQRLGVTEARVRRAGRSVAVPAPELVPGDVVLLEAGDLLPADLRVIESNNLQADESALTGESVPVSKQEDAIDRENPLAERASMLFKGTAVTDGSGAGVVVATGMRTELGKIASLAEDVGEDFTPLERRLERLGHRLIWATLLVGLLVAAAGLIGGKDWLLVLETAIAMAVAAVPEGLPIVATIALARGMWRMADRNALINRLSAVETLGATNIICTDKTGTLTENRMRLRRLELSHRTVDPDEIDDLPAEDPLRQALEVGVLCTNAEFEHKDDNTAVGDPLEVALLEAGRNAGLDREQLLEEAPEVREEAFSADTMMMATFHEHEAGVWIAVKGAPEAVLAVCTRVVGEDGPEDLNEAERKEWLGRNRAMAEEGLRVIALAQRQAESADEEPYRELELLGLAGLWDPPREDVKKTLEDCREAGIRVIMVTGDHPATAGAIATSLGLGDGDSKVLTGTDIEDAGQGNEQERLRKAPILARVSPEQKLNLINLHQDAGAIVAMTGDGVNDAPALQKADIGVAMGERGTQVAREAADMVLRDDRFDTIVSAVYHGRVIFGNIRKFIFFLLSGNVSEILIITLAALVNAPLPLLPLQILYLNLIGDVFPALALGVGEGDRSIMRQPPRDPDEPILTRGCWQAIGGYAIVITIGVLSGFACALVYFNMPAAQAVTVSFLSLSLARLTHVFNMRDPESPVFRNEITLNPSIWGALVICVALLAIALYVPGLRDILGLTSPGRAGWGIILAVGVFPLLVGQVAKRVSKGL